LYSSCASSTWSFPSAVWAWSAEDHSGAVDHRHAERRLEVALLARDQLVVAGNEVGVAAGDLRLHVGELPAPEVAVGVGPSAHLDDLPGGGHAGRSQQLLQLGERVVVARLFGQHPDRERALAGARILDSRSARSVTRLGDTALTGSLHCTKCRSGGRRACARAGRAPDRLFRA
jgi:hypothetical protein